MKTLKNEAQGFGEGRAPLAKTTMEKLNGKTT
jgi:hypothetical protein